VLRESGTRISTGIFIKVPPVTGSTSCLESRPGSSRPSTSYSLSPARKTWTPRQSHKSGTGMTV